MAKVVTKLVTGAASLFSSKDAKFTTIQLPIPDKLLPATCKSVPLLMPNNTFYSPEEGILHYRKDIKRDSLVPCDIALQLLETIDKPVAVLSIAGPTRTGKSYILSRLLGDPEAFELGHTTRAHTKGIWMSTSVLECSKYCILLLDTEGIDSVADQASNDAKILVSTLLLSSYFIYNSKGVPQNNDLQKMSLFTNMTKSIVIRHGEKSTDDKYWRSFPPFLWLLRDAHLGMPEVHGRELSPTEYLTTEVLRSDNPDSMEVAVHKALTQFFPSFMCTTLPTPSADTEVMRAITRNQKQLTDSFNHEVDKLIAFLKTNIHPKQVHNNPGATCDGITLATLVRHVAKAVNDPNSTPALDNTWKQVVQSRCRDVQEKLIAEYCTTIKTRYDIASKGGPLEEDIESSQEQQCASVIGMHNELWTEIQKKFHTEISPLLSVPVSEECTLQSVTDQLEKQLVQFQLETIPHKDKTVTVRKVIGGALYATAEENRKKSREYCNKVFTDLYTKIRRRVESGEDGYTTETLQAEIKALRDEYDKKSIGPEKMYIRNKMEGEIEENRRILEGLLRSAQQHKEFQELCTKLLTDSKKDFEERMQSEKERREDVEKQLKETQKSLDEEKKRMNQETQALMEERHEREMAVKDERNKLNIQLLEAILGKKHAEQRLKDKADQLKEKTEEAEQLTKVIDDKTKEAKEKTKEVEEKTKEVEEKTKEVEEKTKELEEKTKELEETTNKVKEKTKEVDIKTKEVEEKTKEVEEKTKQAKELDEYIEKFENSGFFARIFWKKRTKEESADETKKKEDGASADETEKKVNSANDANESKEGAKESEESANESA